MENIKPIIVINTLMILLAILVITINYKMKKTFGIKHKFQLGDCIQRDVELWDKGKYCTLKIVEIGKKSYRIQYYDSKQLGFYDREEQQSLLFTEEDNLVKVECPKEATIPFVIQIHE